MCNCIILNMYTFNMACVQNVLLILLWRGQMSYYFYVVQDICPIDTAKDVQHCKYLRSGSWEAAAVYLYLDPAICKKNWWRQLRVRFPVFGNKFPLSQVCITSSTQNPQICHPTRTQHSMGAIGLMVVFVSWIFRWTCCLPSRKEAWPLYFAKSK